MSDRLKALADAVDPAFIMDNDARDDLRRRAAALLRAASAETVGTEWDDDPVRFPYPTRARQRHNSDLHAARLAIADLKAERDKATKMAYMILPGDERNPGVTWREAYVILDEKSLGEKHGHACAMSAIAEQHNAALASLAEKQRAIDEALAAWDDWYQRDGVIDKVEAALRPHATKATEAKPSATVTGSGLCCTDCDPVFRKAYGLDEVAPATTPNSVAREIASVESGDIRYRVWECRVIVPADAPLPDGFDAPPRRVVIDAITSRGIDILRCASGWGHTPTDDELGVLDKEIHYPSQPATPATTPTAAGATPAADACDTRELVARLANVVKWLAVYLATKNTPKEWEHIAKNLDAIEAAARRGGGA